jgi:ferredoxin--NADP+ reductase
MARLEDFDVGNTFTGTVKETTRITPESYDEEVRNIVLELDKRDFNCDIGQSVGLLVPGPHEFGNPYHFRLYSVADIAHGENGSNPTIDLCVKRCFYIDEVSGEQRPGVASNFLCGLREGETVSLTGPYGAVFRVPANEEADLLMVGMGTGIAPFRAFVKHIYKERGGWKGNVRLFYGARTGLELVYMNDLKNDFANYYDEQTFKAFEAVSPRPYMDDPVALAQTFEQNRDEVWDMILSPQTNVYVAGLEAVLELLDEAMEKLAGSEEEWQRRKAELVAGERWQELIY